MPANSLRLQRNKSPAWLIIAMLAPAIIVFTLFVIVPIVQAATFSLFRWDGLTPLDGDSYRGLKNFSTVLSDRIFQNAVWHNLLIVIVSIAIEIPFALVCAVVVTQSKFKLAILFRTIFFLPFVLSEVIAGVLWQFIYHPQYGLIQDVYRLISPGIPAPTLLSNPDTVLWAIMGVIIWKYFGFHMMILIAGLQDIPIELKEAAKIDGCSQRQSFWKVTFPLLRPTIQISVFFSIIGSFQIFDMVWAMGKGGPVNASETMATYLYTFGFKRSELGKGSSVAVIIFAICLIFSILYQRFVMRDEPGVKAARRLK